MHSDFYLTGLYIRVAWRVSYKKQQLLTLRDHLSSPPFFGVYFGGVLIFLVFCVVLLCVFTFRGPCCDIRYDFRIKRCSVRLLPLVVCSRAHVLFTLFVFVTHSGIQHILCCVFVLIFFVLYTLCCQFFLIVHV